MLKKGTRVLITGGAGFIGSHLTRALLAAGCSVRVLDDLSTGRRARLLGATASFELLQGDVRNAAMVHRAAAGADAIVHLAGVPAGGEPLRAQEVNLGGTLNVLEAARDAEKKARPRVVLCGSGSVYGKPQVFVLHEELQPRPATTDAVIALAAEQYGRVYRSAYGVPVTALRLFRTFGPDEDADHPDASVVARFLRAAVEGKAPIIFGDGQQTRDLVYVDNVVAAIIAAVQHDSAEVLNIASGEAVAINFLWTMVLDLTGKRRRAIDPTYLPAPPWETPHARPQIARGCQVLGWAPSVRLREALSRTAQSWLAARSDDPHAWFAPRREPPATPTFRRASGVGSLPHPPHGISSFGSLPRRPPPPAPTREEVLEVNDADVVVDDKLRELDIEWAPAPAAPELSR